MSRVHLVVAARPNFMKIAPLWNELSRRGGHELRVVHTGQHYDYHMSRLFFEELHLPDPDVNLQAGSGSHAAQTAAVLTAYEGYLLEDRPDLAVVPGDVNSTLACALAAAKLGVPVAHLEAGLRSFDETMPEEINRRLTDSLAAVLWTPSPDADENLRREGIAPERVTFVGNCMIDSLRAMLPAIQERRAWDKQGLRQGGYIVVTLHRPGNVDDPARLADIVAALTALARDLPVLWPVHPRTRDKLRALGLDPDQGGAKGLRLLAPLGYVDFLSLVRDAALAVTDSGGLQEETTVLGVRCLTVRPNTERPITCTEGSNRLVEPGELLAAARQALAAGPAQAHEPVFWDGRAAQRAADDLEARLGR